MAGMPFQAHPCWERAWADPDMGAILPIKGLVRGRRFWLLFSLETLLSGIKKLTASERVEASGFKG